MEVINATRMKVGYTLGMLPSGRELLVVVIKGTFILPPDGGVVALADEQLPLVEADTFTGAPGLSSPVHETDYAPVKRSCDVLLIGSAHAPRGRPTARVGIGLRIGGWQKAFSVVGDRRWTLGASGVHAGAPVDFVSLPISYDRAFGGTDRTDPDPARHAAFSPNPVGRGFHPTPDMARLRGRPMPNTEASNDPVVKPDGHYRPMALGPIGRNWPPRAAYSGTYDEVWLERHFPFLPSDFDDRYYQSAPADQQIPIPEAEQKVSMVNLTADGRRSFTLPFFEAPVTVFPTHGRHESLQARLDTIVFEPDCNRFTMSWRCSRPLRRDLFEVERVLVGRKGSQWWQQRESVVFPILNISPPVERP